MDWVTPSRRQARANFRDVYSLAAAIGMEDHATDVTAAGGRCHVQRGHDQVRVVVGTHRVAEQAPGEQVDHRGEVELALLGDDLRHVARPDEIGFLGGEVPLDEVRCSRPLPRPGQPASASDHPGEEAEFGHQLRDGVHRDPPALADQQDEDLTGEVRTKDSISPSPSCGASVSRPAASSVAARFPSGFP
jgi:hypothetical protein